MNLLTRIRYLRRQFGVRATAAILNIDSDDVVDAIKSGTLPDVLPSSMKRVTAPALVIDAALAVAGVQFLIVNLTLAVTAASGSSASVAVSSGVDDAAAAAGGVVAIESLAQGDANGGITTRKVSITVPVIDGEHYLVKKTVATGGTVTLDSVKAFALDV